MLDDLKVDDVVIVARGGTAIATVTPAQAKRRMARGGNSASILITCGSRTVTFQIQPTPGGPAFFSKVGDGTISRTGSVNIDLFFGLRP